MLHCQLSRMHAFIPMSTATLIKHASSVSGVVEQNPMKSAYLVEQGYARVWAPSFRQWSDNGNDFRELSLLDPDLREVYNCHAQRFLKICIPLCNIHIGFCGKPNLLEVCTNCHISQIKRQWRYILRPSSDKPGN